MYLEYSLMGNGSDHHSVVSFAEFYKHQMSFWSLFFTAFNIMKHIMFLRKVMLEFNV